MFWLIVLSIAIMYFAYHLVENVNWGGKTSQAIISVLVMLLYGVALLIAGFVFFKFTEWLSWFNFL